MKIHQHFLHRYVYNDCLQWNHEYDLQKPVSIVFFLMFNGSNSQNSKKMFPAESPTTNFNNLFDTKYVGGDESEAVGYESNLPFPHITYSQILNYERSKRLRTTLIDGG